MLYSIILACCLDGGIGYDNTIPWSIREEIRLFKQITSSYANENDNANDNDKKRNNDNMKINAVIMGRNTWNSLPHKPLHNRLNIVITSDKNFPRFNNLISFSNLDDAFNHCKMNKVFVIGGKTIYDTCLYDEKYSKNIEKIYLSVIYNNYESNVFINLKHILKNYRVIDFNNVYFKSSFLHLEMKQK
jgi:dihydrofolate reductase